MDYEIQDLTTMSEPMKNNNVIIPEVVNQSSIADIVGQTSEEYTEKVVNKIQQAGNFIPEIKTAGLTTENLKKIFMGLGVLQLVMLAKQNKMALAGLAGAYYIWKQNQKKGTSMAGYIQRK